MKTQTRMPEGNFHKNFWFSSVKLAFLYALCCLSERADCFQSSPGNSTFPSCFLKESLYRNNTPPFFPLGMHVTRLKRQIAGCLLFSIFSYRSFFAFWNFCARECCKQANLENKIKTIVLITDSFKRTKIRWQKKVNKCMSVTALFLPFIQQGTQVWNPCHRWERKQTGWINKSSSAGNYPGGYLKDSYGCSWHG